MNDDQLKEITRRLDIIIRVLSIQYAQEGNQIEQVRKLLSVGMLPSEIARLLGKPANLITAYVSKINREKVRKNGK